MKPQGFMDKWGIDKKDLAIVLDLSLPQVERWFFRKESGNYQEPNARHLKRLQEVDYILEVLRRSQENIDSCPDHIKAVKDLSKNFAQIGTL